MFTIHIIYIFDSVYHNYSSLWLIYINPLYTNEFYNVTISSIDSPWKDSLSLFNFIFDIHYLAKRQVFQLAVFEPNFQREISMQRAGTDISNTSLTTRCKGLIHLLHTCLNCIKNNEATTIKNKR